MDRLYNSLQDLVYESKDYIQTEYSQKFHKAMQDDFNTPSALSVLFEMARHINILKKENNISFKDLNNNGKLGVYQKFI